MTLSLAPPEKPGRKEVTVRPRSSRPSSTRIMAVVVVATTFVRLARS